MNISSVALFWGTFLAVPLLSCLLLYLLFGKDSLSVVLIAYTAATVASIGIFFYWVVEYFQKSVFLRKLFGRVISKRTIKFVVTATILWLPSISLAFDPFNVEYVTYNGFNAVAGAFQTIGLVFSDSGYAGLFFTAASLGLLFGGMAFYMKKVTGAQLAPLAWAMPVLLGLALYVAFYIPKGRVTVYDEVTGRTQTFGNIPIGITTMAGMTNLIEKGIAGIVTTAGGSSYISGAGGIGYEAVIQVIASGISTQQQSVDMTLSRYIQDCLFFELARPGTTLKIQDIRNGTTDLMTALAQSVNPAAYTVVYLNKPEGETKTCTEAWNMLSPKLNDPQFFDENVVKAACNSAGFDSSNLLEFSACTTTLNYTLQQIAKGNPLSYNDFARKTYIALNIEDFVRKNGAVPLSNYYISQQGSTTALVLNQWIPIIKANLTALILCLTPFLLIFLPTPLAGRVVAMIAGFFIWITMWGIADAITHEIIVTQASNIFEKVRNNKWGYDAIMLLPDSLSRSLSLFGYIRSAGMMLATIMTTMLVKFGGTALAMYAGSITSTVSSSAARGSHEALTPHGSANTIMESSSAPGKLEAAGLTSFTERALASKGNTMRSIWSGTAENAGLQTFGNRVMQDATTNQVFKGVGYGAGLGEVPGGAFQFGKDSVKSQYSGIQEGVGAFNAYGGDRELMQRVGEIKTGQRIGDSLAYERIAKEYGFSDARQAAQALGEITHGEGFAHTASVRDFASRYGMSNQQALQFIANSRMASNEATFKAFGGDVRAYEKFLENNMDLSIGQQQGIIGAAQKAGIDLRDYGKTTSFMESMKKVGAIDAYKKGEITDKDLIDIGKVAALKEAGDADAARRIEEATGKDPREFVGYIRSSEGVNELAKFEMRQRMAEMLGFGNDLRGMYEYLKQSQGIDEVVLNPEMAKELNKHMHKAGFTNFRAKAGDVVKFGYDESTGTISMAHSTGGGKSESYNLNTVRTGNDVQQLDINKKVRDHMNVDKGGGTEITMVTPDGVKTGYLTYDPKLKRPVLVAGQEKYGIDKYMVVDQPEKRDASGKIVQPAGKVVQSVTVDPKTGEVVQGKNVSLLITEGEIQFGGRTFKGTLYQDTRTGNKLFIDGKSGNFWTITEMEDAWTMHRSFEGRGEYFSSIATNIFGKEAGAIVSNTEKGLSEVTRVISSARAIRSLGSGSSRSFNPKTFSGKPMSSGEERNSIIKPASKYTNIKNIQKQ